MDNWDKYYELRMRCIDHAGRYANGEIIPTSTMYGYWIKHYYKLATLSRSHAI